MRVRGTVTLDGSALGCNDPNGWRLNSASEIELLGTACEAIKGGNHDVTDPIPVRRRDAARQVIRGKCRGLGPRVS